MAVNSTRLRRKASNHLLLQRTRIPLRKGWECVKEQTGISRAQYEILAAEYIAHAEDDGSKVSEMFKGDSSEKHKSKGWNSASTKNKRS